VTRAKRAFDLAASVAGLCLILPLLLIIVLVVKADGGPAFFRQERVGLRGRRFRMWKFRTMVPNAERLGPQLTVDGDRRITKIGRWLRRTKLDELPQLFNVVVGEMSLVGARPEVPRYVALYSQEQRQVLEFVPGITDPASIIYRAEGQLLAGTADPEQLYTQQIMPEKIRLNLAYAKQATVRRDFSIIVRTIAHIRPHASAHAWPPSAPSRADSRSSNHRSSAPARRDR
jgi:lipopolysaccharide/colanic/teichoic acid biosynthesis glycosyltransferase